MTSVFKGPGPTSEDLVVTTVDEEIRQEALRQLESTDCDDDHWRIEPLPEFSDSDHDGEAEPAPVFESTEQANRQNN